MSQHSTMGQLLGCLWSKIAMIASLSQEGRLAREDLRDLNDGCAQRISIFCVRHTAVWRCRKLLNALVIQRSPARNGSLVSSAAAAVPVHRWLESAIAHRRISILDVHRRPRARPPLTLPAEPAAPAGALPVSLSPWLLLLIRSSLAHVLVLLLCVRFPCANVAHFSLRR